MVIIITAVNETPSAILVLNENKKVIARTNAITMEIVRDFSLEIVSFNPPLDFFLSYMK